MKSMQSYSSVCEKNPAPDLLINGARGNREKCVFNKQDIKLFMEIVEMNLIGGMVLPVQVFTSEWIKQGIKGSIINISSLTAYKGLSGTWTHNAAKSAVVNLTQGLAKEFAERGIRVNLISSGFFVGKQNHDLLIKQDSSLLLTDRVRMIIERTPMGRFGDFDELKGTVLFLGSNKASGFVTGNDIPVDGGFLSDNI